MRKFVCGLNIILFVAGCATRAPIQPTEQALFVSVDSTEFSPIERRIVEEASDDFHAVIAGRRPVHATFDKSADLPTDGGTAYYLGKGYRITVVRSISTFGGFTGYAYGPILTFDPAFAPGNESTVSNVRIYSFEGLEELLARGHGL